MARVTVLMPVYNGGPYLRAAIQSIVDQTYTDWTLRVLDDASTDGSAAIARSFTDPRIQVLVNAPNRGLAGNLNQGLDLCQTEYLARMDQDDLSHPRRLEAQVAHLDAHPEVALLGTGLRTIGSIRNRTVRLPDRDGYLKSQLFFHCALAHPTLMFRMAAFRAHGLRYDAAFEKCEDYDLWTRAAPLLGIGSLEDVLFTYRIHQTNMSRVTGKIQTEKTERIRLRQLAALLPGATDAERSRHLDFCRAGRPWTPADLDLLEAWQCRLSEANRARGLFPPQDFDSVLAERWKDACRGATRAGLASLRRYRRGPFGRPLSRGDVSRWTLLALVHWGHPAYQAVLSPLRWVANRLRGRN
ncbi:MAG: glycosyltransferase [Spirochaetes bacterium]|nr:glycosyltransferase [Spirochaetota bacterium]